MRKILLLSAALMLMNGSTWAACNQQGDIEGENCWDCAANDGISSCEARLTGTTLTVSGSGKMKDYEYPPEIDSTYGRLTKAEWAGLSDKISAIHITEGISNVGLGAFTGLKNVESVKLANSVTEIGRLAFADSSALTNLELGNNVETIGSFAFGNTGLFEINLPDTLQNLKDHALWSTSLQGSLVLPDNLKNVGEGAFTSLHGSGKLNIYCRDTAAHKCDDLINSETKENGTSLIKYAITDGYYTLNSQRYHNLKDMMQDKNRVKKIYTIEEAMEATKNGDRFHVYLTYK